jgi:hypothetical protein
VFVPADWHNVLHRCVQGRTQGGGGSRRAAAPSHTPKRPKRKFKKNIDFVDIMISKVLRDFPFSRNQPLKSADDWYITILKNKLITLKKYKKTGHCD